MVWIEAQPTPIIALIMFSFCYVLAATTFGLAGIFSRQKIARDLKAVSPVTLTPLAVILGLLIGFLAYRVWTHLDHATEYVGQEAGALREAVLLADALPPDVRTGVRQAIQRHINFIAVDEWPAMARREASLQSVAVGLAEAMTAVLSFDPLQPSQQLAQRRALVAIEQALEARRSRVRMSQAEIAPIQWATIIVLGALVLVTIAMIHIENLLAVAVTLFVFSTALAICLVLLMVFDRPFGAGGFTVSPTVLRDVMPN